MTEETKAEKAKPKFLVEHEAVKKHLADSVARRRAAREKK